MKRIYPTTNRYCFYCKDFIERPSRGKNKFCISWKAYQKRKFCSTVCHGKWLSENKVGEKSNNWRGGKTRCIDCGKLLADRYTTQKTKRCAACWYKFIRNHPEESPNWKGGRPKCKICGGEVGDRHSKTCQNCHKGINHHCWEGGKVELGDKIRGLPEYSQWYRTVFHRDNYTCQKCGKTGDKKANFLSAHHLKSFAVILKENSIKTIEAAINCKELWNINNGQSLCKKCHKLTDTFAKRIS